ncbi:MAG: hypothetical protein ACKOJI_13090, partial [Phycisphaerales bacterium]
MTEERARSASGQDDVSAIGEPEQSIDFMGFVARHLRAFVLATAVVGLLTVAAMALVVALPPVDRSVV